LLKINSKKIKICAIAMILYLCICAYYTIFQLRIYRYYRLDSNGMTDENSLIFSAMYFLIKKNYFLPNLGLFVD